MLSNNKILQYMLDVDGKESNMSYYCYKTISKTQKNESIFIVFHYDFEANR